MNIHWPSTPKNDCSPWYVIVYRVLIVIVIPMLMVIALEKLGVFA